VLVLVFSVLKPMMKSLLGPARPALPQMVPAAAGGPAPADPSRPAPANGQQPATPLAYEQQLALAKTLVSQDPKRVAQVVRTWVAQDE